ncbi:hypothetical protein Zmor_022036 [Zophobas morio]|uniref:Uncharacterized protein n=1 Tax=Zophobas morio TaxID=2755281 RepID=A0AA38I704_9CUCU|nr:hypothetical protein Zmor_022036 [Zophobas morio]
MIGILRCEYQTPLNKQEHLNSYQCGIQLTAIAHRPTFRPVVIPEFSINLVKICATRSKKEISNFEQSRCNGPRYCNTIWVDSYCVIVESVTIVCGGAADRTERPASPPGPLSVNHVS